LTPFPQRIRHLALHIGLTAIPTAGLAPMTASATTVSHLDVTALARDAELIVAGRVEAVAPYRERGRIYTRVHLRVGVTLKASRPAPVGEVVDFSVHGGELDGIGQFVAGQARFEVGEQVLVFLTDLGRRPTLLGLAQGKWAYDPARQGAELTPDAAGLAGLELIGRDGRPVPAAGHTRVGIEAVRDALRAGTAR